MNSEGSDQTLFFNQAAQPTDVTHKKTGSQERHKRTSSKSQGR